MLGVRNISDMSVVFIGSHFVDVDVVKKTSDICDVTYVVGERGSYDVHVMFRGAPITGSPFEITEMKANDNDVVHVTVKPKCLIRRATFWCRKDLATEKVECELLPLLTQEQQQHQGQQQQQRQQQVKIQRISSNVVQASFLPTCNGQYKLTLLHNSLESAVINNTKEYDSSLLYSSVTIPVTDLPSAEDLLTISGNGVKGGIIHELMNVFIESDIFTDFNLFSVVVDDPPNIDVVLRQLTGGKCCVSYTARKCGSHKMSLKYDGFDIPIAPLKLEIKEAQRRQSPIENSDTTTITSRKSDAWLCRAYGDGLRRAAVSEWSSFHVNCHAAATGVLTAGLLTEKGSPSWEVAVRHLGEKLYNVEYRVGVEGSYCLTVMWEGEHISGSPFRLHVSKRAIQ